MSSHQHQLSEQQPGAFPPVLPIWRRLHEVGDPNLDHLLNRVLPAGEVTEQSGVLDGQREPVSPQIVPEGRQGSIAHIHPRNTFVRWQQLTLGVPVRPFQPPS
jgi:hypothetical protein